MPKRPKRPADPFLLAVEIGRQATGQEPKPPAEAAGKPKRRRRARALPAKRRKTA